MSLEDKYIPVTEVSYKGRTIKLPRTVYVKKTDGPAVGLQTEDMKAVFEELIKDPGCAFRLIDEMCRPTATISTGTACSSGSYLGVIDAVTRSNF